MSFPFEAMFANENIVDGLYSYFTNEHPTQKQIIDEIQDIPGFEIIYGHFKYQKARQALEILVDISYEPNFNFTNQKMVDRFMMIGNTIINNMIGFASI